MQEKENVLKILKETRLALIENNPLVMKELSNKTIHSASIYQDPDNIIIAVLIYALSKIIERKKYQEFKDWKTFFKNSIRCIEKSISALEKDDEKLFQKEIAHIRKSINLLSPDFKKQIQEVFRKSEINKASRIYEHGISMQKTANLLGISIWELAEYAGSTGISEVKLNITLPESERIRNTEEIFR